MSVSDFILLFRSSLEFLSKLKTAWSSSYMTHLVRNQCGDSIMSTLTDAVQAHPLKAVTTRELTILSKSFVGSYYGQVACLGWLLKLQNVHVSQDNDVGVNISLFSGPEFLCTFITYVKAVKFMTKFGGWDFYCLINNILDGHNYSLVPSIQNVDSMQGRIQDKDKKNSSVTFLKNYSFSSLTCKWNMNLLLNLRLWRKQNLSERVEEIHDKAMFL